MADLSGAPQICMYLPAYDKLSSYFQTQGAGSLSPLLAGSCARTVAVLATSPVELLKTRLQNAPAASPSSGKSAATSYITVWQSLALHRQVLLYYPPPLQARHPPCHCMIYLLRKSCQYSLVLCTGKGPHRLLRSDLGVNPPSPPPARGNNHHHQVNQPRTGRQF